MSTDTIDKRLAPLAGGWQATNIHDSASGATRLLVVSAVSAAHYWH
jgi:hypothetical protein